MRNQPSTQEHLERRFDADDPANEAPKFLCDEMLNRLGRWLRAAGYDTTIAAGSPDGALLAAALRSGRLVLTRDREMAARRLARGRVVVVEAAAMDALAQELSIRVGIDWLRAPFTRCLIDNTPLRQADPRERDGLPPKARAIGGPVYRCRRCRRLYWPGSHLRRMRHRLERWQEEARHLTKPFAADV